MATIDGSVTRPSAESQEPAQSHLHAADDEPEEEGPGGRSEAFRSENEPIDAVDQARDGDEVEDGDDQQEGEGYSLPRANAGAWRNERAPYRALSHP